MASIWRACAPRLIVPTLRFRQGKILQPVCHWVFWGVPLGCQGFVPLGCRKPLGLHRKSTQQPWIFMPAWRSYDHSITI
jgi:hypothetical protein